MAGQEFSRDELSQAKYGLDFDELSVETAGQVQAIFNRQPFPDGTEPGEVMTREEITNNRYGLPFSALSRETTIEIQNDYDAQFGPLPSDPEFTRDEIAQAKYGLDFDELSVETAGQVQAIFNRQPFPRGTTPDEIRTREEIAEEKYDIELEEATLPDELSRGQLIEVQNNYDEQFESGGDDSTDRSDETPTETPAQSDNANGPSSDSVAVKNPDKALTINGATAGNTVSRDLAADDDSMLKRATFEFTEAVENATFEFKTVQTRPDGTPPLTTDESVAYLRVEQTINESTMGSVTVDFTVASNETAGEPAALTVYRLQNGGWTEQETTLLDAGNGSREYQFVSTGFSDFAIAEDLTTASTADANTVETEEQDLTPPTIEAFDVEYNKSRRVAHVSLEASEGLGSAHVLVYGPDDTRLMERRLVEAVGEDVYDRNVELPAVGGQYTIELADADDRHNNKINDPWAYTRTIAVDSAEQKTED